MEIKKDNFFDATALRAKYDYAMPYPPLQQRHLLTEDTPHPEITNLVYGVPYFSESEDGPPLYDRWRLAGTCMSDCLAHNDRDAHYVTRIKMPGHKQVCSVLMHVGTCIISGPKSIVDLLTVCNTLVKKVRADIVPHGRSFYVGSFANRLHNTVVRLNMGAIPVNFANLEGLLRPRNVIRRSDDVISGGTSMVNAAVDRIPHFIMAMNVVPKSPKKKNKNPLIKMYEHKMYKEDGTVCILPKVCINGIPSIDLGKAILLEFYFFILEHRDRLLFSRGELLKMQTLHAILEPPPSSTPTPSRRKRLRGIHSEATAENKKK